MRRGCASGAGAARGVRRRPDRGHQPLLPRGHAGVGVGGGLRRVPAAGAVHAQRLRHRQLLGAPPHRALRHPRRRAGARLRALLRRRLRRRHARPRRPQWYQTNSITATSTSPRMYYFVPFSIIKQQGLSLSEICKTDLNYFLRRTLNYVIELVFFFQIEWVCRTSVVG